MKQIRSKLHSFYSTLLQRIRGGWLALRRKIPLRLSQTPASHTEHSGIVHSSSHNPSPSIYTLEHANSLPEWRQPRRIPGTLQSLKLTFANVKIRRIILAVVVVFILLTSLSLILTFRNLPDLNTLPYNLDQPSIRITDRNGRLLYDFLPANGGRNIVLPLDQIQIALNLPRSPWKTAISTPIRASIWKGSCALRGSIYAVEKPSPAEAPSHNRLFGTS